jgi:arylsulfatase A-like enzyme
MKSIQPKPTLRRIAAGLLLAAATAFGTACSQPDADRPNVLFIVWDTVRADRMSLYGCENPTTPFLDVWAKEARVFDNCSSTANSTVPSHAAMFTGLYPIEHGANNSHRRLDERFNTLAEIFRGSGYGTYLFAANPHISQDENFHQGFDVEEHPWDEKYADRAMEILRAKIDNLDRSSTLPQKIRGNRRGPWNMKAAGALAQTGFAAWLDERAARGEEKPYFAFLNYMEAHRPLVPAPEFRKRMMTPGQTEKSFAIDRSWNTMWSFSFGLHEYTPQELDIMTRTYDACIAELDALLEDLITALDEKGYLDNTIIVLTSDHGEHLGEHHLLDHQYSLYEGLLRVPLVVRFPGGIDTGRDGRPVSNIDLFPTLIELAGLEPAGLEPPREETPWVRSLLAPDRPRLRLAQYPSAFAMPIDSVLKKHPDWDPTPFRRKLDAIYHGDLKLISASDGSSQLFNVAADPGETEDLAPGAGEELDRMNEALRLIRGTLRPYSGNEKAPAMTAEQRERLQALGYLGSDGEE